MAVPGDCRNTVCISKSTGAVIGKQIHSKPYESLCESAQGFCLFHCELLSFERSLGIKTGQTPFGPCPGLYLVTNLAFDRKKEPPGRAGGSAYAGEALVY